jgi:hypothetical protein
MPKVKRVRVGRGFEEEFRAAQERDRVAQEDKKVADAIRSAAAADAKRRGGKVKRARTSRSRK